MAGLDRPLRLGVAGLGRAFTLMLPTFLGDARVHLAAKWRLLRGADGSPLASPTTVLESGPLPEAAGIEHTVAAMSAVYGELSRVIAQAVPRQEKAAR